jgi:hypothetical protein
MAKIKLNAFRRSKGVARGRCRILVIEDDCEAGEQILELLAASAVMWPISLSMATTD